MKSRIEIQPIQESPSRREKRKQSWRGPLERASRPLERWSLDPWIPTQPLGRGFLPLERVFILRALPLERLVWPLERSTLDFDILTQPLERPKPPLERVFTPKLLFFNWAAGCPRLPFRWLRVFDSSILRRDRSSEPSSMVPSSISP